MRDLPPRRRAPAPAWTRPITERLTPAIKVLVIAQVAIYLFYVMVREARPLIERHLVVGPGLMHGEVWQPVTALFVHLDVLSLIFNLIGLWYVGAFIERTHGTRRFLQLFFVSGILAFVAVGLLLPFKSYGLADGCSYSVLALFVAFGRMYGRTPVQVFGALAMQARFLAIILVAWAVLADLTRGDWAGLAGTAVATAVGYVLVGGIGVGDLFAQLRTRRLRRRYRVLDGGGGQAAPPKDRQDWN
jgi:rhomboid protease GluP